MIAKPKHLLRALVRTYRYCVSPLLPQACRFYPSCSEYAETALQDHGALHGGWLTVRRLCRCGPWHAGGFDPVPEVNSTTSAPMQGQR